MLEMQLTTITLKINKPTFINAIKYLAIALPLLLLAPIVITIGFKALRKDDTYILLIAGIVVGIIAILVTAFGLIKVSRYLFDKDRDHEEN